MGRDEPGASGPWSESDLQDNLCWVVCCWKGGKGTRSGRTFPSLETLPGFEEMCFIFAERPLTYIYSF